ncbi:MAG: RNA methyltransferase [Butyrivibrio sp.]|nr:RNA methyltransferase [Butyrivibrio sp.]
MQVGGAVITSASNSQVKNIINLLKRSGERKRHGLFVIEGIRMFKEAPFESLCGVYVSESFARANGDFLCGYSYETVREDIFARMSDTKTPQGILATVRMPRHTLDGILKKSETPLLAVLENIQDPGNLGTIIRTAEGAGADGIIMSRDTADIFNPKAVRSTMGSLFRMPFVYTDDICTAVRSLGEMGINTCAAHLEGAEEYYNIDYRMPSAVLIGNEGAGLSEALTAAAKSRIKIPMRGKLESLNAAVSAAVVLYEAARQRAVKAP